MAPTQDDKGAANLAMGFPSLSLSLAHFLPESLSLSPSLSSECQQQGEAIQENKAFLNSFLCSDVNQRGFSWQEVHMWAKQQSNRPLSLPLFRPEGQALLPFVQGRGQIIFVMEERQITNKRMGHPRAQNKYSSEGRRTSPYLGSSKQDRQISWSNLSIGGGNSKALLCLLHGAAGH